MSLSLITAPVAEPVSLDQAKEHLRVDESHSDTLIAALITAARQHCEQFLARALLTQTWELVLDYFPGANRYGVPMPGSYGEIMLARPPLQSVTWVKYYDTDGVQQTLPTSDYQVDTVSEPARIAPAYGKSWPSTRVILNAITVRFVAGWTSAALVPTPIKQAMLLLIGHYYENREAVNIGNIVTPIPMAVDALLWPYRIVEVA